MARPAPLGEDTALNLTPMIDVCFQLVVFFMLTLEFKSIDRRFETQLPKTLGPQSVPSRLDPVTHVSVRLFRKNRERPVAEQFTRIRVAERLTVDLPPGPWPVGGAAEDARRRETDARLARVRQAIAATWEAQARDPKVRGEIRTPFPDGQAVPHGDVVQVFDAFLGAGFTNVDLEGAAAPLPEAAGGGWSFR
jgi:biopolymer transport protein ExbD